MIERCDMKNPLDPDVYRVIILEENDIRGQNFRSPGNKIVLLILNPCSTHRNYRQLKGRVGRYEDKGEIIQRKIHANKNMDSVDLAS